VGLRPLHPTSSADIIEVDFGENTLLQYAQHNLIATLGMAITTSMSRSRQKEKLIAKPMPKDSDFRRLRRIRRRSHERERRRAACSAPVGFREILDQMRLERGSSTASQYISPKSSR